MTQTKQFSVEFAGQSYDVTICKNKSITVSCYYANAKEPKQTINTFSIGDFAEYDSYNFSYTGVITAITDKTVTIVAHKGTQNEATFRLKIHSFCWRNWNFDLQKIRKERAAWCD